MANLARMAFKGTQAGLRPREAKVITTCSSAWWADRAKIRTAKQRQSDGAVGQTAAVTHAGTWLIRYDGGYSESTRCGLDDHRGTERSVAVADVCRWSKRTQMTA